jgi:hypothetical protein
MKNTFKKITSIVIITLTIMSCNKSKNVYVYRYKFRTEKVVESDAKRGPNYKSYGSYFLKFDNKMSETTRQNEQEFQSRETSKQSNSPIVYDTLELVHIDTNGDGLLYDPN